MLFNSYLYIFFFLPLVVLGFFSASRFAGQTTAICWLILASLFFYSWWNPAYVLLLGFSVLFNYRCGRWLINATDSSHRIHILVFGITANLALLGYYKYLGFFAGIAESLMGYSLQLGDIVLPLAISFFTFQQIAYLVDAYKGEEISDGFLRYCLFITFFPQLIAGPIVHHKEMMPQFRDRATFRFKPLNLSLGSAIFTVGLFKKVVLADSLAVYVDPAFSTAATGGSPGFYESWLATSAFSLQVYFDFSGYSDMAIGAALIMGIQLPVNFFSPYKATSITEAWRRWHMTLTRFVREYIYMPISLRLARLALRWGRSRWLLLLASSIVPVVIAFVLVGLWHGAGWNFVLFGLFHGSLLALHAAWRELKRITGFGFDIPSWVALLLTTFSWLVGIVMFRAVDVAAALKIYSGMFSVSTSMGVFSDNPLPALVVLSIYVLVFALPNTEQLFNRYRPGFSDKNLEASRCRKGALVWSEKTSWAIFMGILFSISVVMMTREVVFIYFQF